jgi:APA family basic amino acid/polyamine antiporter
MAQLIRALTAKDLTVLVICSVIGSGIFLVPGVVLRQVDGSMMLALLVWIVAGILSLLGGLTYGELSAQNPQAGGLYTYIRDCFGPFMAFIFGWTTFLVIGSGSVATLAVAFPAYLNQIIPLNNWESKIISVLVIVIITVVNIRGVKNSATLQNYSTFIKVGAIILISLIFIIFGKGLQNLIPADFWPEKIGGSALSGFGIAMISVLWAYEGWQYATYSAAEVVNPQRNFPRAFLIGLLALISLYLLAVVGYIAALGVKGAAAADAIAATSISQIVGPNASKILSAAILVSIFSAANTILLTTPRLMYAMASDGLFFKKLSEVNPRFHTPVFAIVVLAIWSALLALTGTFQQLLTYVVFVGWIFYGLGGACVFFYRKTIPPEQRPYKTPGYPITPILFVLAAAALVLNTIYADPKSSAIGLAIVFTGAPAYLIWRRKPTAVAS